VIESTGAIVRRHDSRVFQDFWTTVYAAIDD
jgi:hypothetical protein